MKRMGKSKKICLFFAVIIAVSLLVVSYVERFFAPIIRTMAVSRSEVLLSQEIANEINETMSENGITYGDIISFVLDKDGRINAMTTNIVTANKLKSFLALSILTRITNVDETELSIPVGNLTGISILSGRGPEMKVKVIPIGSVQTELSSQFVSAGINQTQHRIIMEVTSNVDIILPSETVSTTVSVNVVIAETVIVGSVPDSYAEIRVPIE
ncbi:MAG: sporulation protein YunB [Ruminococcaceae bacterium]|nr:sporulation protein YunB [Oscillospiraceae bacterium]